jgi:hypothetical protein
MQLYRCAPGLAKPANLLRCEHCLRIDAVVFLMRSEKSDH